MKLRQLQGVRLSQLARCPRACALGGRGVVPEPPSERMRRYWTRGQMFTWYAWRQFSEQHGEDAVEREREIAWPLGVGHCDLYVRPERQLVEVKSSTSPSGSIVGNGIRQLKMYLRFDPEAESAMLYVIDPSDLDREDLLPVRLTDDDIAEIDRLVEEVAHAIEGGDLPACAASSPNDCRRSGCGFSAAAWEGWTPDPAPSLDDPALVEAAAEWYRQREFRRQLEQSAEAAKIAEAELRDRLTELGLPEGESIIGGKIHIRRTSVAGRITARIADARKAGVWTSALDQQLGDFIRIGQPSERWIGTLLDGAELISGSLSGADQEVPF